MEQESHWYRAEIVVAASRYGLDPHLVEAIVRVESGGLTHAYRFEPEFFRRYLSDDPAYDGANPRRWAASYGLMQVMASTAREELDFTDAPESLFVPTIGLDAGCHFFSKLLARVSGDVERAIAAYNGGFGGSRRPFSPAVQIYVHRVQTQLAVVQGEAK